MVTSRGPFFTKGKTGKRNETRRKRPAKFKSDSMWSSLTKAKPQHSEDQPLRLISKVTRNDTSDFISLASQGPALKVLSEAVFEAKPVLVEGPMGCGKTRVIEHLAAVTQRQEFKAGFGFVHLFKLFMCSSINQFFFVKTQLSKDASISWLSKSD